MFKKLLFVSVVVPAYNAASSVGKCLLALQTQTYPKDYYEIILVDDGSNDNTAEIAKSMGASVFVQSNRGAAVARNLGAKEAKGEILLFTDADCEPQKDWIQRMVEPFTNPEIVGVKGFYKTKQRQLMARFAQIEYNVKCEKLKRDHYIDFVDTYSAGYRRNIFLEVGGFDAIYTTASGEDSELSYKLASMGYKMVAVPNAFVFHYHPDHLFSYLKKKYRNAYWRVVTWQKYPSKIIKDSHTPNSHKFSVILSPLLLFTSFLCFFNSSFLWVNALLFIVFLFNEATMLKTVAKTDSRLLPFVPFYLYLRGLLSAFGAGVKAVEVLRNKIFSMLVNNIKVIMRILVHDKG